MGSGFRTFASGEVLTADNVQNYLMDQAVMVFAGTAARASALPTPEVGMTAYSTATGLQVYNGTAWVNVSTGYGAGTGGSGTAVGTAIGGVTYNVHTFSSDANFVVTSPGLFDVLLVGGGGGGGGIASTNTQASGGGGAGALVGFASTTTIYLAAGTVAIDIGAGGASDKNGFASYIGDKISACGGGRGGYGRGGGYPAPAGNNGGSGGGSSVVNDSGSFDFCKSVDQTFGNDGGFGDNANATTSGGGGGYGSAGGNAPNSTSGGAGGNGVDVSSWGTSASTDNVAAGGGGGGSVTGGAAGTGGVAGKTTGVGNAATTAGSGGGGTYQAATTANGGAGAAGKVWIRYRT